MDGLLNTYMWQNLNHPFIFTKLIFCTTSYDKIVIVLMDFVEVFLFFVVFSRGAAGCVVPLCWLREAAAILGSRFLVLSLGTVVMLVF